MAEGNGVDLGHLAAMLQSLLTAQEVMRAELKADIGSVRAEVAALRADHGRRLDDLAAGVKTVNETITHYHASVLGHGILITELQERVGRLERHVGLAPA